MIITIDELEKSKVFVAKNEIFKFQHPLDYFRPFMEVLNDTGVEFDVQVEGETTNADREGENKNTSYARVALTARLPQSYDTLADVFGFDHLWKQIGMVYALDTQKPEMKVYRGNRVSVCTNQCVFGADNVTALLLASSSGNIQALYDQTKKYVDTAMSESVKYKRIIEYLANQEMNRSQLMEHIGDSIVYARKEKKLGVSCINEMVGSLMDEKSKYHINMEEGTNKWLTYNAITEALKKVSIIDEASKTLLLSDLFIKDKSILAN